MLCGVHHIAVHAGTIRVDGTFSTGFVFRHGDGAPYGGEVDAGRLHLTTQVFASLTKMGFKASEARARIELAVRAGTPNDFASLIREALRRA